GKDNKLLWYIPEDFKRFKELTSGHVVIMGRKTYESLPENFRPLPNRINIMITRDVNYKVEGVIVYHSLEEVMKNLESKFKDEVFIIGGAEIYKQGIKYADKLYLTLVDKEYLDADAFFPEYGEFKLLKLVGEGVEDNLHYKFVELMKSSP
ncbi:MAG: dihydrofolate reductase, partial [Patescibacteria group bacterium]